MKLNSNTIILAVISVVLIGGGYWYVSSSGEDNDQSLSSDVAINGPQVKFQALVNQLEPIRFDTGIFSNARFNALVDITTPIAPESPGRIDPFAPIAGSAN